jgi:hypothetical protein
MSNKDEALRLINEIAGMVELMGELDPVRATGTMIHIDDLKDIINDMENGCQCK